MTHSSAEPRSDVFALDLKGLVKDFGGVRALDRASLRVRRGTIHGLVGQNGAGKSTLIKILAGIYTPDEGTISVEGGTYAKLEPRQAERLGIQFIHQDRLLVPTFTVGESVFLGQEETFRAGLPLLARRRMERRAADLIRSLFDVELPRGALIGELSTAQRQIVQITRALVHEPSILVFDEPTAALVQREVDSLLSIIRGLRERGITIVYISHYLEEIRRLCDEVTVLRNGVDVATVDPRATTAEAIASLMIARDVGTMFPPRAAACTGPPVLAIEGLTRRGDYTDVNLAVGRGDIVGLTGLLGSGTKALVETLFGLRRADGGRILVNGEAATLSSPVEAARRGIAFVPEDRRRQGAALDLNVRENVTLASLARFSRAGLLDRRAERAAIAALQVKTPGPEAQVRTLSGGNQQKVVLAKWLCRASALFVVDEPTVGVDIGAKAEIYALLRRLASEGSGILLLSSDLDEIVGLCDRVAVMYRGRIVVDRPAGEFSPDLVLGWSNGREEGLLHAG
jgi:ribose transport system ATP-binding protein